MDIIRIEPNMLKGAVSVPPSKSVAHRAIMAAALSGGSCTISNVAMSKDIEATLHCMEAMGFSASVNQEKNQVFFHKKKKKALPDELVLNCNESGSTLRFLIPLALLTGRKVTMTGEGRLMQRPQKPYLEMFSKKGLVCVQEENCIRLEGILKPGLYKIAGNISSQFITGLLFALCLLDGESEIQVTTNLESKGYVDLTLAVLRDFGIEVQNINYRRFIIPGNQAYQPRDYTIEGDYSQGAFFLVAGALGCDVSCMGLSKDSLQGDKKILELLKEAGAQMTVDENGHICAKRTDAMKAISQDVSDIPDLVPILAVLCSFLPGESRLYNAGRLRMKESDRLAAITAELRQLGADIEEGADYLKIRGKNVLSGATVSAWNDHRIAMACAIAACRCEGVVTITGGKAAVKKSYPDFFEVYEGLQKGPRVLLQKDRLIVEEEK